VFVVRSAELSVIGEFVRVIQARFLTSYPATNTRATCRSLALTKHWRPQKERDSQIPRALEIDKRAGMGSNFKERQTRETLLSCQRLSGSLANATANVFFFAKAKEVKKLQRACLGI
jgi:hypothetical protein